MLSQMAAYEIKTKLMSINTQKKFQNHLLSFHETLLEHLEDFCSFIQNMARIDETWQFWAQFVFEDVMACSSLLEVETGI